MAVKKHRNLKIRQGSFAETIWKTHIGMDI